MSFDILKELENAENEKLNNSKNAKILENSENVEVREGFKPSSKNSLEIEKTSKSLQTEEDILLFIEEENSKEIVKHSEFIIAEEEEIQIPRISIYKKILSFVFTFTKYSFTSLLIFVVLMFATNYSAYLTIAESYIKKDEIAAKAEVLNEALNSTKLELTPRIETIQNAPEIQKSSTIHSVESGNSAHSISKIVSKKSLGEATLDIDVVPYENRIVIPKLDRNVPIIDLAYETVNDSADLNKLFEKELQRGVVKYPGTANPGENGNSFIFGHSSYFPWAAGDFNSVFSTLGELSEGDEIIVYYNQKKYVYKVTDKKVVKPGDVSVLKSLIGKKQLSLMTCWPIGTNISRLIVITELVEVS